MSWLREILHPVLRLASGELVARLASFALMGYISRHYGVDFLGAYALAQTVAMYVMQGTDQGLKLIGARMVAREAHLAHSVVSLVTRKRSLTALGCVVGGLVYSVYGPMPNYARLCVAGLVLGILPYAVSLDWLAWGLSHFGCLASWRAGTAAMLTISSLIGFTVCSDPRVSLICANFFTTAVGSIAMWMIWRISWSKRLHPCSASIEQSTFELRWGAVLPLGLAAILTQMFHNFDTILLAAMAPMTEVGRYSAAYKVIFLVCSGFYLITQSIYPRLSASSGGEATRRMVCIGLGMVGAGGCMLTAVLFVFARPILTIIYGNDLGATHLLRILIFAVPMDFAAALLGVSFTSRGFERFLLLACGVAALCNFGINLILIPSMGADGAAMATIISYILLISILLIGFAVKPVFAERLAIASCPN